ncbi:hypothetical protein FOA52_012045 [Chlamydomonas sp. UWO 241]|nr:hypothetical protein FOA52_012045 [Chlamydomonas sp. UWO 241]
MAAARILGRSSGLTRVESRARVSPAHLFAPRTVLVRPPDLGGARVGPRGSLLSPRASSDAASSGGEESSKSGIAGVVAHVKSLFNVYTDPVCNQRLLVLIIGQMLCSIATLIHDSYLPVYAQDVLGLSNTSIGAVQGLAQFLCQITKGVSGVAGDLLGSQVRVLVFGTAMTLLCKPMFVALSSVYAVAGATACLYVFFFAKLMDRMSKGIREAPTKAIMNELARESGDSPDAAYGLRQSLATAGMLAGSTIAAVSFYVTGCNYEMTFALAMVPPALALAWMVKNFSGELFGHGPSDFDTPLAGKSIAGQSIDIQSSQPSTTSGASMASADDADDAFSAAAAAAAGAGPPRLPPLKLGLIGKARALVGAFKPVYWQALAVVAILYLARFDPSFIMLRAKSVVSTSALPMLTLVNTLIQVVLTAPLAKYSGQSVRNRNTLLLAGFAMMVAADAAFGLPIFANPAGMVLGASCLGLHMAMTHSITVSMIASYMPAGEVRGLGRISGTAVSFTDLLLGFVLVAGNTAAGMLSDITRFAGLGNVGCFAGGAVAAVAAAVLLALFTQFGDLGRDDLVKRRATKSA